jgi:hypothetical protein
MKLRCQKKIRTTQAYVLVCIYSQGWIKHLILTFWHWIIWSLKVVYFFSKYVRFLYFLWKKKECILIFYPKMVYMIGYLDLTNLSKNINFYTWIHNGHFWMLIYPYLMGNKNIYIHLAQDISKTTFSHNNIDWNPPKDSFKFWFF